MIVVSDIDRYISTTWGASIRLEAGVPKEVGMDIGIFCLQEGCTEVKPNSSKEQKPSESISEVKVEDSTPKKAPVKKPAKKTTKK
jgi:hypothetical protein